MKPWGVFAKPLLQANTVKSRYTSLLCRSRYYTTFDHPQQNSVLIELGINLLCHRLHSLLCHVKFMDTVLLYTVLWIKTALLHDYILYKSVQKQSVA